ncbi:MAG: cytidine deaminase, partial [bacterium]|nr:cytidine deaminase [bacterium]
MIDEIKDLFDAALKVRENSYSPYSRFKVGAAVQTSSGKIFAGTNVENSSFGATVCAERI